jgi:hypothetical protein
MDIEAYIVKTAAWLRGLYVRGWDGARKASAGLAY